ncbi:MAG: MFS transporter [Actinomycetota bacterium]
MTNDRRALRSVALQFFANGMVYGTFIPRLPEIRDRVDISVGVLGVVLMTGSVFGLLGSLVASRVNMRFGTKRVLIVGGILSVGALPLVGWATTPVVLVAGLAIVLFFDVFIDVGMNIQGSALSARRHTPVMNRLHGLWSLGSVTGGTIAVIAGRADVAPPWHLTIIAIVLLGALAVVAPGLLPTDEPIADEPLAERVVIGDATTDNVVLVNVAADEIAADDVAVGESTQPAAAGESGGRGRPLMIALAVAGFAAMTLEIGNGDWAAFRLGDDLDAAAGVASAAFVAFTVGMTIGRFGGDFVLVRIGGRRLAQVAAVVAGVASAVATLVPVTAAAFIGFVVAGLGVSVLFPGLYDAAARTPNGSGFASMLVGQRSATIVVPLAIGALADTAALNIGQAMAIMLIPAAVASFVATTALSR